MRIWEKSCSLAQPKCMQHEREDKSLCYATQTVAELLFIVLFKIWFESP